jgi:hypothetical protein
MRSHLGKITFLCVLVFLVSCQQGTLEPTTESGVSIRADDPGENEILKEFSYNQCLSNASADVTLTYGQVLSESFSKELTLGLTGTLEAEIPATAKASIEAEIKERFLSEKKTILESSQAASFTVPANSRLKVTILLRETVREGEASYVQNGETYVTGYSYRTSLEVVGLNTETIPCSAGTPTVTCENGFDATVWTPVTTNTNMHPVKVGDCWQLQDFGMSMSGGTISFLENEWDAKARWYGVTREIPVNAKIQMEINLAQLVEGQIWIGFTESSYNISNGEFLVIKPADNSVSGSVLNAFNLIEMDKGVLEQANENVFVPYDTGKYSLSMTIEMNRLLLWLNNGPAPAFPVTEVDERYLFIGYLAPIGIRIDGTIVNIQIEP